MEQQKQVRGIQEQEHDIEEREREGEKKDRETEIARQIQTDVRAKQRDSEIETDRETWAELEQQKTIVRH